MYPSHDSWLAIFQRYITDRKRTEEKLRRSEAYLAEAQRLSHIGSWAWNASTAELFWSQEHFRICGLDPETAKLSYPNALQCIHSEDRPFVQQAFEKATREGNDFELDYRIVRPDRTVRHIHSLAHPVFNQAGYLAEYVGTIIDTTDHKRAEEELQTAQAELAYMARVTAMGELAASIAHEVNQPLTAVITHGNACLHFLNTAEPNLNKVRATVTQMVNEGHRAGAVIREIRSFMTKTPPLQRSTLDLNQVIEEVVSLTRHEIDRQAVSLRTELAGDLLLLTGNRIQLQQVILNLLMNAIEATSARSEGPRKILLTSRKQEPDRVLVAVRDSGVGIDPHNMDQLFEPFFTTKTTGMGLGLSISRSIVEAYGGRLWAVPNEGVGTTFQFSLPATKRSLG
jgi:PAS domain S-box-containing protein